MLDMVGPGRVHARHHDDRFDPVSAVLEGHDLSQDIAGSLARRVWAGERVGHVGDDAPRVNEQSATLPPHGRQYRAVYPNPCDRVYVDDLGDLFWPKGF